MRKIFIMFIVLFIPLLVLGEEIERKDGQIIQGQIVDQRERKRTADSKTEMPLTYYADETQDRSLKVENLQEPFKGQEAYDAVSIEQGDYEKLTMFYYENPNPGKMIFLLTLMIENEERIPERKYFDPFVHLIATIAQNDAIFLNTLKDLKKKSSGHQHHILREVVDRSERFVSPEPKNAKDLDFLWSEFIATGHDGPVKKIISVLSQSGQDLETALLMGAAQWSLSANAKQHSRVLEILKKQYSNESGPAKDKLKQIIDSPGAVPGGEYIP